MENATIELAAWHEAGRVVFAYLTGYTCDSMELPGSGSGGGSKLNSGNDLGVVKGVLSGDPMSLSPENMGHGIEVARKLMTIYCAGSCAESFFENNASVPEELDMEIPASDIKYIEKIQTFLQKSILDHPEDYPMQTMVSVFKKLKDPDVWKAVQLLAAKVSESETKTLSRFYIEDTLMLAGIRARRAPVSEGFSVGVREDETVSPATQEPKGSTFDLGNLTPLDIMLRDFLKRIKNDWKEGELDAAMKYLHNVYKKYGSIG